MVVIITAYLLYTVREGCSNAGGGCGSTIHQTKGVVLPRTNMKSTDKDDQTPFGRKKKKDNQTHNNMRTLHAGVLSRKKI